MLDKRQGPETTETAEQSDQPIALLVELTGEEAATVVRRHIGRQLERRCLLTEPQPGPAMAAAVTVSGCVAPRVGFN